MMFDRKDLERLSLIIKKKGMIKLVESIFEIYGNSFETHISIKGKEVTLKHITYKLEYSPMTLYLYDTNEFIREYVIDMSKLINLVDGMCSAIGYEITCITTNIDNIINTLSFLMFPSILKLCDSYYDDMVYSDLDKIKKECLELIDNIYDK